MSTSSLFFHDSHGKPEANATAAAEDVDVATATALYVALLADGTADLYRDVSSLHGLDHSPFSNSSSSFTSSSAASPRDFTSPYTQDGNDSFEATLDYAAAPLYSPPGSPTAWDPLFNDVVVQQHAQPSAAPALESTVDIAAAFAHLGAKMSPTSPPTTVSLQDVSPDARLVAAENDSGVRYDDLYNSVQLDESIYSESSPSVIDDTQSNDGLANFLASLPPPNGDISTLASVFVREFARQCGAGQLPSLISGFRAAGIQVDLDPASQRSSMVNDGQQHSFDVAATWLAQQGSFTVESTSPATTSSHSSRSSSPSVVSPSGSNWSTSYDVLSPVKTDSPAATFVAGGRVSGSKKVRSSAQSKSKPKRTTGPSGANGFACDQCSKRFDRLFNLTTHKETHLPEDQRAKPFACPIDDCGRRFSRKADQKRHCKTVHGGEC